MTRLPEPKKSVLHKRRVEDGLMTINQIGDDVTRFDNISALDEDFNPEEGFKKKKRKIDKDAPKKKKFNDKNKKKKGSKKKIFKKRM